MNQLTQVVIEYGEKKTFIIDDFHSRKTGVLDVEGKAWLSVKLPLKICFQARGVYSLSTKELVDIFFKPPDTVKQLGKEHIAEEHELPEPLKGVDNLYYIDYMMTGGHTC
eukprot:GHVS01076394.1.p1 GENE.GHVS01076394.1~~GHVS01076394.1.p1  ORF type:complete len:110 (+),score=4.18 GHVS01076394.1:369-698(+)